MRRLVLVAVLAGLMFPVAASAYRPPLSTAYPSSDHRAWYECFYVVFPLDPFSQRCATSGTYRDSYYRHTCNSFSGRDRGAWCFTFGHATNNVTRIWRLGIRVSENCAACYGYRSRTYSRTLFNAGSSADAAR